MTARPQLVAQAQPVPVAPVVQVRDGLWGLRDLRQLTRTLVLSSTGLVLAWLVASGTTHLETQVYAVAGGIVATTLAVSGLAGWLLNGVRALRAEQARALPAVRELIARRTVTSAVGTTVDGPVSAPGMTHHHRPDCLMVKGKTVYAVGATQLRGCPICTQPEAS